MQHKDKNLTITISYMCFILVTEHQDTVENALIGLLVMINDRILQLYDRKTRAFGLIKPCSSRLVYIVSDHSIIPWIYWKSHLMFTMNRSTST